MLVMLRGEPQMRYEHEVILSHLRHTETMLNCLPPEALSYQHRRQYMFWPRLISNYYT